MNPKDQPARDIVNSIRQVLLTDWDPIGVLDEPTVQDEYDSYIGGVYRLLFNAVSAQSIAAHLAKIESEQMGLSTQQIDSLLSVARKLKEINVVLEQS